MAKEMTNEVVDFNVFTVMEGKFGQKGSTKLKAFNSFSSLRLLLESGFVPTEKQTELLQQMSYKWFYHVLNNETKTGSIIITLHKKDINVWSYAIIDEVGNISSYDTIQNAKLALK